MKLQRKKQKSQKSLIFGLVSGKVASLIFSTLLFVGFISVCRMVLGQEILYSKISKNVPLDIILRKEHKSQKVLMFELFPVSIAYLIFSMLLYVQFFWASYAPRERIIVL